MNKVSRHFRNNVVISGDIPLLARVGWQDDKNAVIAVGGIFDTVGVINRQNSLAMAAVNGFICETVATNAPNVSTEKY